VFTTFAKSKQTVRSRYLFNDLYSVEMHRIHGLLLLIASVYIIV